MANEGEEDDGCAFEFDEVSPILLQVRQTFETLYLCRFERHQPDFGLLVNGKAYLPHAVGCHSFAVCNTQYPILHVLVHQGWNTPCLLSKTHWAKK